MEKKRKKYTTGTFLGNIILLACLGVIISGLGVMAYFVITALISAFF